MLLFRPSTKNEEPRLRSFMGLKHCRRQGRLLPPVCHCVHKMMQGKVCGCAVTGVLCWRLLKFGVLL